MGAFSGSMTYKLFFVQGELPSGWKEQFLERVAHRRFRDLKPDDEDEESYGWVPIDRPLDSDFPLAHVLYNDYLNLGFRRDKYSLSTDRLKAELARVTAEFIKQNEIEKLTKMQRDDLKTMVRNDLKRRTLPAMKVTDMSWNISTMQVRFWSQSAKLCELFQGVFEDTFGLKLMPSSPYINGMQCGLDNDALANLALVEPTNFVQGRVGAAS